MVGIFISLLILLIALYGYFISIKASKLEKQIRKNKIDYECFKCKEKFSVNETKCPKCAFITLYGNRKKKIWLIIPIFLCWFFILSKFIDSF